ncbi:hypothetical protein MB14_13305 [Roseivirga ehrenbergii]|uniref:Uncharacterized protein n=2 Tax=Roseivirga ehrenbergii (strain DSM 102268 / JCM 13514 / KCTC 12282 / NCIMB 14502 / KMM 6017) TaxID=279360 RepID=A0A150XS23_ROSEK|nr:hypothetical protein MB14_13305 [Roseivirga ehrenbergii]
MHFLTEISASNEKNMQLDIFRDNGEVLLQIFKSEDVKNWNIEFDVTKEALIFQLLFNKNKTENSANLSRFLNSSLSKNFQRVEFYKQETYFATFPYTIGLEIIQSTINQLISEVYNLEVMTTRATLKAY